ncbi:MAG: putative leader peptide [Streptosporangiaceae bacterium]
MVTSRRATHSIVYVPETIRIGQDCQARPQAAGLTRRRAVDFCRVATAICCPQLTLDRARRAA